MPMRVVLGVTIALLLPGTEGYSQQSATPTMLGKNRMVEWSIHSGPMMYRHDNFTVVVAPAESPLEDAGDMVEVRVHSRGVALTPNIVETRYGLGGLGIFDMGLAEPVLVVAPYSGGAHCCTHFDLLPLTAAPLWRTAGGFDGDIFDLDDVDGDGVFEIARPDPRFRHAEGATVGSWAAPLIVGFRDRQLTDVTHDLRYRSHLLRAETSASADCGGGEGWFMEGCVAWGTIARRLGTYDEVLMEIATRAAAAPEDTGMAKAGYDVIENEINEALSTLKLNSEGSLPFAPYP